MSCPEFGEWADAVRGDPAAEGGFGRVEHLVGCSGCRTQVDAVLCIEAGFRPEEHRHLDPGELASDLVRGRVPAGVWSCARCLTLTVESLRSIRETSQESRASETTRRRLEKAAQLVPRRSASVRWWVPAGALAGAAALAGLWISPAADPWARQLGLSRGSVWRMSSELAGDLERTVESGELTGPLFDIPSQPIEIERDPFRQSRAPITAFPRWEAVRERSPAFRFTDPADAGRYEIFLLDADRRFVWSREIEGRDRVAYPADVEPLEPGATYYWKVNALSGEQLTASAFTGFRVLTDEAAEACVALAERHAERPFVRGVVLDRCGLYTESSEAFGEADGEGAERLGEAVRSKQGISP